MAKNLIDNVRDYLTPDVVQKIGSFVGESPGAAQKGMENIVPALLTRVTEMSSSADGISQLDKMLNAGSSGSFLNNLPGQLSGAQAGKDLLSSGSGILQTLFGGNLNSIIEGIASFLGMKGASVSSLMKIAAPLVLGVLAKERTSRGVSTTGLANLLAEQRGSVARLLPAGLAGVLGTDSGAFLRTAALDARPHETEESEQWWLWPAIGLLALALLTFVFWGRDFGAKTANVTQELARYAKVTLPDGKILDLKEGSFYHNLERFLASATDTGGPQTFVFENLHFEFGSAKLTADSRGTLDDLVTILRAYPSVQVRLEGHTDDTGDPAENKKLSLARAETTKEIMVGSGIDAGRIATAGYGDEKPIASNQTEEGKAKNRRLELVVTKRAASIG